MALSFSMDKIGVMGRTADDCAIVLSQISGHDPNDSASSTQGPVPYSAVTSTKNLRIGWLTNAWKDLPADIESALKAASAALKSNAAIIEEAKLPEGPWEPAAGTIISVECAAAFDSLIESEGVTRLTDPLGKIGGYIAQQIPATDYTRALRIRAVLQRKIDALFDAYDVVAAASLPVTASPLTANLETDLSFADPLGAIGNLCGLPTISVPCGFAAELPVGIQFVARAFDDQKVIDAARLFQQHTDWHTKHPPLT